MAVKYTSDDSDEIHKLVSDFSHTGFPVTVLSWNIFGATSKGMAKARKEMLRSKISSINPDVLLLQETKKGIDGFFEDVGISEKDYKYPKEARKNKEAWVIYKTSVFEEVEEPTVDERFLDTILEKVFPKNGTISTRSGEVPGRQTIKDRVCVDHLRHKSSRCEIIFVSFHNIYYGKHSTEMASKFCTIIGEIYKLRECYVVAGVDFNTDDFESKDVDVPDYKATERRKNKRTVDYFILSKPTVNWKVTVQSYDLFPGDEDAPFHKNIKSLLAVFTKDKYYRALDHDPLVLQLKEEGDKGSIIVPSQEKEEEEDEGKSEKEKMKKEEDLSDGSYLLLIPSKGIKREGDEGSIISPPRKEEEEENKVCSLM